MLRLLVPVLISTILLSGPGSAQEVPSKSEKPATPEIATCKTAALQALHAKEPEIKDIYIDEDGPYETLAGFVMNELGEIPQIGDVVLVKGVNIEVVAMQGRRVTRLHVTQGPDLDQSQGEEGRVG